ncbi:macro domain-containing protein [Zobellella denitrificans]
MRYFFDSITSWAYWRYVLFSASGAQSVLSIFGAIYLLVEVLDFFNVYTRDKYGAFGFLIFLCVAAIVSISVRRPIKCIQIAFPHKDYSIEVRIGDIFETSGAIMISTNSNFEADVAGGRIATNSLQGQFTARYFTGNQNALIDEIEEQLRLVGGNKPFPMGTTIPITTHGKTFYFTAMAALNQNGNASSTLANVKDSLDGLWTHVRNAGELQELAVPLVGTGRGRLNLPRKKMIELIAESFVSASMAGKFTEKLVICIRPEDAQRFQVNLYDVKDHLKQSLVH